MENQGCWFPLLGMVIVALLMAMITYVVGIEWWKVVLGGMFAGLIMFLALTTPKGVDK